jgi:protein ImuB
MSATTARTLDPELQCVVADVAAERALLRAVADGLLGVSPRVELGGAPRGQHHVMHVEVPTGRRGSWFGGKLREMLAVFGLRARIGIADDRFAAFVAATVSARDDEPVVCVPRGGSAAFLAPHPLSLLPLGPEVQHMLEALGVRTLGAFAQLPPPSVMRPERGGWDADFQALARGDGGVALDPYAPVGPVGEREVLSSSTGAPSVGAAVESLATRLAVRLAGRAGHQAPAVELMLRLTGGSGAPAIRSLHVAAADADNLADAIGRALGGDAWGAIEAVARLDVPTPAAVTAPSVGSVEPIRHEIEPIAPLVLLPSPTAYGRTGGPVEHRRTRRGKQRPRIGAGQARLFAGD